MFSRIPLAFYIAEKDLFPIRGIVALWIKLGILSVLLFSCTSKNSADHTDSLSVKNSGSKVQGDEILWKAPDTLSIPQSDSGRLIQYGRNLIKYTSKYLGPKGSVRQISNGMNCQNCHLEAGTKPFGNNYSAVASTYPKFRPRSGGIESIEKRVNDCLERSLNGRKLDTNSREMRAIVAYIHWLGQDVKKGESPNGSGLLKLPYLDRAADPQKGSMVYVQKCQRCHGENGEGVHEKNGVSYQYPPLWGPHSYNIGAGLYRLSRFAGYVKANMPYGTNYKKAELSDEEAWDVAAFVNSKQRPEKKYSQDWPNISLKPIDHPFGPFVDSFSEQQHKYGPFQPILSATENKKK